MKIEINLERRYVAYIVFTLAVLTGINYAIAQTPWANPITGVGHGLDELEPCADGQILETSNGNWTCADAPIDTNAITLCSNNDYLRGDGVSRSAAEIVSDSSIALTNCAWTAYTGCGWGCTATCPSGKTPISGAIDNCAGGDSADDVVTSKHTSTGWEFGGSYASCAVLCCD